MARRGTTKQEIRGNINFLRLLRLTRPVLKWFGLNLYDVDIDGLINNFQGIAKMTTDFNKLFAERGWISHGWLSTPAAERAIEAARAGNYDEADRLLVEAYGPDKVTLWLNHMSNLRCFRKRVRLARLAAEDYEAGRFHACVPVVLALLDGMGQELTGAGFLRQGARFVDDDSFLELGPGMAQLVRVFTASRGGTTTGEIDVPFRHGILHGVDLGYANDLVAAKAWAALIAAGSYAQAVEEAQAPKPEQAGLLETLTEYGRTLNRGNELEEFAKQWQARAWEDIERTLQRPPEGTPEQAVVAFLEFWRKKNFGELARASVDSRDVDWRHLAGRIGKQFPPAPLEFSIATVEDSAPAAAWVAANLTWAGFTDEVRFRMLYYDEKGLAPSNSKRGRWLIASLWPLESLRIGMEAVAERTKR